MKVKSLDERIRQCAREAFKKEVKSALEAVDVLIKNPSPVAGLKFEGKDITNRKLLEVLAVNLMDTQSLWVEETALDEFMREIIDEHQADPQKFPFLSGQ